MVHDDQMLVAFSQHFDVVNPLMDRVNDALTTWRCVNDNTATTAATPRSPLTAEERANTVDNYDTQEPTKLTLRRGYTVRIIQKSDEW